jgi:hypothetical protein
LKKILLLGLGRFYRIIAPHVEGNYAIKALGKDARAMLRENTGGNTLP